MGRGHMPIMGPGMGFGMMGPGMAHGFMQPLSRDLSAEDVQHMLGHRLAMTGNPNIKLGTVSEKDDDTIVANQPGLRLALLRLTVPAQDVAQPMGTP